MAPERRARAIAAVTAGLTVSTALGAPLGTIVGAGVGWRGTMWFVAALGVGAALAIRLRLPPTPAPPAACLRDRLAPLRDRRVAAVLATTLLAFAGIYLVYTYISVVLAGATGSDGLVLAVLLFVFGVFATVGNFLAGAAADRLGARTVVAAATTVLVLVCLLLAVGGSQLATALPLVIACGLVSFAITGPQQHRLITLRPDAAPLLVALNASFIYLAVAVAGGLGGLIVAGPGGRWVGPTAAVFLAAAFGASELAHRCSRPGPG